MEQKAEKEEFLNFFPISLLEIKHFSSFSPSLQ